MRGVTGRDFLLVGLGLVIGVLGTLLWPTSTFEQCMVGKIHDPSPELFRAAYQFCKDLPRATKL